MIYSQIFCSLQENESSLELYNDMCVSYSGQCLRHLEIFDDNLVALSLIGVSEDDIAGFINILNQFMDTFTSLWTFQ